MGPIYKKVKTWASYNTRSLDWEFPFTSNCLKASLPKSNSTSYFCTRNGIILVLGKEPITKRKYLLNLHKLGELDIFLGKNLHIGHICHLESPLPAPSFLSKSDDHWESLSSTPEHGPHQPKDCHLLSKSTFVCYNFSYFGIPYVCGVETNTFLFSFLISELLCCWFTVTRLEFNIKQLLDWILQISFYC